tara:strand:- start:1370 stop:2092 length:723 start_codon:yes stop_codon:yes gene_type:complete
MSPPTDRATLVRLRRAVVAGEMTADDAAQSVGIPRGTLASRWRIAGIVAEIPMVPRHTTRQAVAAVIAEDPSRSDAEVSARLVSRGVRLNTSSVRRHRVALGIGTQRERMQSADPSWMHPTWRRPKVTDEQLRDARQEIESRRSTVRRVAARLNVSTQTLYDGWHRLGLVRVRPSGCADDSPPPHMSRSPVRDEVAAHLRDYPWMSARDIADSMTADGYRISASAVHGHLQSIAATQGAP